MPDGFAQTPATSAHARGVDGAGLDLPATRARFSALPRRHAGSPVAYLDGPGGSQTPDSVARAVAGYLTSANANCDGSFVTSEQADRMLDEARFAVADSLGCGPDEIVSGAQALPPEACRLIRL